MNRSTIAMTFDLEHSYTEKLAGFFAEVWPASAPHPNLLQFNRSLACELGWDTQELSGVGNLDMKLSDDPKNKKVDFCTTNEKPFFC